MSQFLRTVVFAAATFAFAMDAFGACTNRFLKRSEGTRQIVTLLTGKLTFQEAQALAAAINKREAPPLEWVDEKGKSLAKQFGELRVIRPMPVACDGKASGVIVMVTFTSVQGPSKKMFVKLNAETTVEFEEQSDQAAR